MFKSSEIYLSGLYNRLQRQSGIVYHRLRHKHVYVVGEFTKHNIRGLHR